METNKPLDIDGYIASFPEAVQQMLQQVRNTIKEAAPGASEAIKYVIPTFTFNGNLVHFAGYKKHTSAFTLHQPVLKLLKRRWRVINRVKVLYSFRLINQCR